MPGRFSLAKTSRTTIPTALVSLLLTLLVLGPNPCRAEVPTAEELLALSIAYHDPDGLFFSEPHRLYFLETRPGGADRRSEVLIDIPGEQFEMVRAGEHEIAGEVGPGVCRMTLDGRTEVSEAEQKEHRLSCERLKFMRNYYIYLWGLPMKLRDPGTRLGKVSATTFEDKPVYGLRVTYDDAVGEDIWYFYFDQVSHALAGYRFYHDEAKNDGEVILLEGEVAADGMRLPKRRTWITHGDERLLGTDTLLAIGGPEHESINLPTSGGS
jgi:hypothetical protein